MLDAFIDGLATEVTPFSRAVALLLAALGHAAVGEPDTAGALGADLAAVARVSGFRQLAAMAGVLCGWASDDVGDMRASIAEYEAGGSRMLLHAFLGLLADVEQRSDDLVAALATVRRALSECESTGERFWEVELHRQHAELLLASAPADAGAAQKAFDRGLALARSQRAALFEARLVESRGRHPA